jgi:hypothetical protein
VTGTDWGWRGNQETGMASRGVRKAQRLRKPKDAAWLPRARVPVLGCQGPDPAVVLERALLAAR